jgi:DNA polymerase epsilon subunit 1
MRGSTQRGHIRQLHVTQTCTAAPKSLHTHTGLLAIRLRCDFSVPGSHGTWTSGHGRRLADLHGGHMANAQGTHAPVQDALSAVEDIREYDVPFHIRYAIDTDLRCGHWYSVSAHEGTVTLKHRPDLIFRAEPRVCAFDIETTKLPMHFPNSEHDQVCCSRRMRPQQGHACAQLAPHMYLGGPWLHSRSLLQVFMISYMLDKQGYLIVNRAVVGADISPFEYTPKAEFPGPFHIFNEADEVSTLKRWFAHMAEVC